MPTLCNCIRCETAGTFLQRRDAAPVATSAGVSHPLGGASARNLSPVTAGRAGGSDSSLLGSSGAFNRNSHGGGDTHVSQ